MRLLLREPVESLGEPGDEVNVRAGYARNYLLPRRIAVPITEDNRREVATARERWAVQKVADLKAARALADSLEGRTLRFERRVKTDSEDLYGSVTVVDIARELGEAGFEIARSRIIMGGPIKSVGTSEVTLRLHPEVETNIAVEVEPAEVTSLGMDHPTIPMEARTTSRGPDGEDDELSADGGDSSSSGTDTDSDEAPASETPADAPDPES